MTSTRRLSSSSIVSSVIWLYMVWIALRYRPAPKLKPSAHALAVMIWPRSTALAKGPQMSMMHEACLFYNLANYVPSKAVRPPR